MKWKYYQRYMIYVPMRYEKDIFFGRVQGAINNIKRVKTIMKGVLVILQKDMNTKLFVKYT